MRMVPAVLVCAGFAGLAVPGAQATAPFHKRFEEKYVIENGNADFVAAIAEMKCNVCHVPDKPKKQRNAYGNALADLIPGNAQMRLNQARKAGKEQLAAEEAKLLKELDEAFKKVETLPSDPTNDKSATFGELIKEGKLPGGP